MYLKEKSQKNHTLISFQDRTLLTNNRHVRIPHSQKPFSLVIYMMIRSKNKLGKKFLNLGGIWTSMLLERGINQGKKWWLKRVEFFPFWRERGEVPLNSDVPTMFSLDSQWFPTTLSVRFVQVAIFSRNCS